MSVFRVRAPARDRISTVRTGSARSGNGRAWHVGQQVRWRHAGVALEGNLQWRCSRHRLIFGYLVR
jgi:hypothetical protein